MKTHDIEKFIGKPTKTPITPHLTALSAERSI